MRTNLDAIVDTLESNEPASQTLRRKVKAKGWLGLATNLTAEELVTLVLGRIEHDANQYGEFIAMLRDIEGMDLIVKTLPGMAYYLSYITSLVVGKGVGGFQMNRKEGEKGRNEYVVSVIHCVHVNLIWNR